MKTCVLSSKVSPPTMLYRWAIFLNGKEWKAGCEETEKDAERACWVAMDTLERALKKKGYEVAIQLE